MNLYKLSLAILLGAATLTSCSDKLELTNPNEPTTGTFGYSTKDLEDAVKACYHHIRMEGTYARVGYTMDICRGDEVYNPAQSWGHLPADHFNFGTTTENDQIGGLWIWRDWYYVINICNFVITRCDESNLASEEMNRIKGQALFIRGLAYYNLSNYYQNPALILNYHDYSTLDGLYASNKEEGDSDPLAQYDRVLDQVETDLSEAMNLLPSRDLGGEWAKGRATVGAAAGFYARALMQRHKYNEALVVLKDIIAGKYGKYELMKNYGDNFRETSTYENNAESLFEVQFLDYGSQGTDDEWTPVNISKNASQGHAVEANFGCEEYGGWKDLSAQPWLYQLYKSEKTKEGRLDPRLYWTIGTHEADWEGFEYGNVGYTKPMTDQNPIVTIKANGGLPIAKWTNMRPGLYETVVTGLKCGINLRLMRYSDVLLRAAECENEVNGPTQQAIDWINQVRNRAELADLNLSDFGSNKDKLFEQIANVERPKEFGCENGRGFDLIRWGFFYNEGRLHQMKEHGTYRLYPYDDATKRLKEPVSYSEVGVDPQVKSSFDTYRPGHEYFPLHQSLLSNNFNLVGNSANTDFDNSAYFQQKGWTVHPVVDLSK